MMLNERDPELLVERYRNLTAQLEVATHESMRAEIQDALQRLRERWHEWAGDDSLHEMAFGEG
jgi:hypothetical protein